MGEASRISKFESICILFSIAFGVGYIDVVKNDHEENNILIYVLGMEFMFGMFSCYMLY